MQRRAALLFGLLLPLAAPEGEKPAAPPAPPKTVYVPYSSLDKALSGETPGVYLPYEEFLELWGRSFPEEPPAKTAPPGEPVLSEAEIAGVVSGDSVDWTATLSITARRSGWSEMPLGFAGAALRGFEVRETSASAAGSRGEPREERKEGRDAFVVPSADGGYTLFLPHAGTYSARLDLTSAVEADGDSRAVQLAAPPCAIARASLTIDASGIRPAIGRARAETIREEAGRTTILGLLPSGGFLGIRWTKLPAEFAPGTGFLFTTVAAASEIRTDVERLAAAVSGRVMRAFVRSVRVRIPDGFALLAAAGDGVADTRALPDGTVEVAFDAPRSGFALDLRLERPRPPGEREIVLAAPSVVDATRESAYLAAETAGALRASLASAERAVRIAPGEWPSPENARPRGSLLFRRLAPDARVVLAIEEIRPRFVATLDERLEIADSVARLRARARLRVSEAGLFEVTIDAPAGFAVESVGPEGTVREHRVTESAGRLSIAASLATRALGDVAIDVVLRRDGDVALAPLTAPIARVAGAEREDLVYSVAAAEHLNVTVSSAAGFDPVDAATLAADRLEAPPFPDVMAFRSSGRDGSLVLAVLRRKTRLTAAARSLVRVEEDRLAIASTTVFTVQNAARDTFTLLVPEALDATLDVRSTGVRLKESTRVGPRADRPGFSEWRITLQSPAIGDVAIDVTGEVPVPRPAPGGKVAAAAPLVFAADVERETGHVAVTRAGNLEIEPRASALEPIDPRELPEPLARADVFLAWRYLASPASLDLDVVRHDYQPVVDTAVTHLHVDTVVAESGVARSVALLEVRNSARQYLETLLPGDSSLLAASVNGVAVRPNRRPGDPALLVPLPLTEGGGGPAGVRLLYETRLGAKAARGVAGTIAVDVPRFLAVPVLRLTLRAYLPEPLVPLSFGGTARLVDDRSEFLGWVSSPTISALGFLPRPAVLPASGALPRAAAGTPDPGGTGGGYALDLDIAREGREYLFTKLDGDAIALVSWASGGFFGFLRFFAIVLLPAAGLLLSRSGRARKLPFVVVAAVSLAVVAPFAPPGLLRLLDSALVGLLLLAAAWGGAAAIAFFKKPAAAGGAA